MQTKTDWDSHIAAWKESDLSKAEYCRRNGLKVFSFYRLTAEHKSPPGRKLVKLPFNGFPIGFNPTSPEPSFEFHLEFPFHFRFRLNVKIGRRT